MYSLHIEADPSIESFAKSIKAYTKEVKRGENELLKRLAHIGADAVKNAYASTDHVGDGGIPTVSTKKSKGTWTIIAFGEEVTFVEFGTGTSAGKGYTENVNISIAPWSYSATEGTGEGAKYGSWHHKSPGADKSTKYTFSTPAAGFVKAKAEMLNQAPQIAKEIFGK